MGDDEIIRMLRRVEKLWILAAHEPDRFRAELPMLAETLAAEGHPPHIVAKIVREAKGCVDIPHLQAISASEVRT